MFFDWNGLHEIILRFISICSNLPNTLLGRNLYYLIIIIRCSLHSEEKYHSLGTYLTVNAGTFILLPAIEASELRFTRLFFPLTIQAVK